MVNIYIKSFNRPYYLDRCLASIALFVEGDYEIVILDDGTPEKYLQKIQSKYPNVTIRLSEQYSYKIKSIQENLEFGSQIDGFKIPISLWKSAVSEGSEYFIMTEDDVWFTDKVNLNDLLKIMQEENMVFIKLGWISQRKIQSSIKLLKDPVLSVTPKIILGPRWFMKNVIFRNKWKIYSLMYKLNIVDNYTKFEYWTLNALLMGMFRKDYWLAIWETLEEKVDEKEQLINASNWYRQNKRDNLFGKLNYEMMNTTYVTSATNSYHKYGNEFDVNHFNFLMNEAWFKENLDSMDNFPKDISQQTFGQILDENENPKATKKNWLIWANKFKDQYRKQQVNVD